MISFFCAVCHWDATDVTVLDEEQRADRLHLTVVNGQMVCMEHVDLIGVRALAEVIAYARSVGAIK